MAEKRSRTMSRASHPAMTLRTTVRREDGEIVRDIVSSTGHFRPDEINMAVELLEERLRIGLTSGYHFIFAERDGRVLGYSCYGPVPLTLHSYDLYWIAVRKEAQGAGFGKILLERTEAAIGELGGRRIYIETSSKEMYNGTRRFYEHCGYRAEATLREFYSPGDDKVIYVKAIGIKTEVE
jgi:GNAT superfamily N-acetyltransferase